MSAADDELIDTGIAQAWMSAGNDFAEHTMYRVWVSLRADKEWNAWLSENTTASEPDAMVQFDDRDKPRIMLRGAALSYFVPLSHVEAAQEARTMTRFAADLFRDVYVKWADKRGLEAPPEITEQMLNAVPDRFP